MILTQKEANAEALYRESGYEERIMLRRKVWDFPKPPLLSEETYRWMIFNRMLLACPGVEAETLAFAAQVPEDKALRWRMNRRPLVLREAEEKPILAF